MDATLITGLVTIITTLTASTIAIIKAIAKYYKKSDKRVDKLTQAFNLYVQNNGVPAEIKKQVQDILNKED